MTRSVLPAVLLLVAGLRADPPTAEQLQRWVRDLDSPAYKTRDQAARQLRQAGADAAPVLAKAARTGSPEVSERAMQLLGEMADSPDEKLEAAARRYLRRLADGESGVAGEARTLLKRKRDRILGRLTAAGARYREERGEIVSVNLDKATELPAILPLLTEFRELEELSISNRQFTDAEAKYLADLPSLRDLNLYRSNMGDEGLKHLTKLKNLRWLPMGETKVTDKGLEVIGGMTQLEYVGVRGNDVTDAGLVHLKDLTGLTGLYLGETKVTDEGLKSLAPLTRLRTLYLHTTAITDAGLEQLTGLKDLRAVYLGKTKTTEAGRLRLKEALPDLDVYDGSDR